MRSINTLGVVFSGHVLPEQGAAADRSCSRQLHLPGESPAAVGHPAAGRRRAACRWPRGTSCQTVTRTQRNPPRYQKMDPPRKVLQSL